MGGGQHHHRRSRGPADSAKTESCQSRGDRRISFEQNRTVMQILTLTPQTEERLLARRAQDAAETHAIAATIIADVPSVVAVCPAPNPKLLVAAGMLGVERIARIGGAQAIAALAYGTKSVPRVDKIFGPGNKYVTAAKQIVSSDCAIDLPAGPTEAMVFAEQGNARWIAADLLAQAEHAKDAASFFITTSHGLAGEVQREIQNQLAELPGTMARCSTQSSGAILIAESVDQACEFINRFAPEHLSLPENAETVVQKIHSAGTVFLGPWGTQPLGHYATGSNHVLPTGGWARRRGGLSSADFVKCISVQTITGKG